VSRRRRRRGSRARQREDDGTAGLSRKVEEAWVAVSAVGLSGLPTRGVGMWGFGLLEMGRAALAVWWLQRLTWRRRRRPRSAHGSGEEGPRGSVEAGIA